MRPAKTPAKSAGAFKSGGDQYFATTGAPPPQLKRHTSEVMTDWEKGLTVSAKPVGKRVAVSKLDSCCRSNSE